VRQADLFDSGIEMDAVFGGPDDCYRYRLSRMWDEELSVVNFLMLNPSTASHQVNDPTVIRCIGYSKAWGYGGLLITNLFALRSTDPDALKSAADPVGPLNDRHIAEVARSSAIVVAAWGAHPGIEGRARDVRRMLADAGIPLHCLALTKGGHPGHPLFLKSDLVPVPMEDR
jgi:hypothetical protein